MVFRDGTNQADGENAYLSEVGDGEKTDEKNFLLTRSEDAIEVGLDARDLSLLVGGLAAVVGNLARHLAGLGKRSAKIIEVDGKSQDDEAMACG